MLPSGKAGFYNLYPAVEEGSSALFEDLFDWGYLGFSCHVLSAMAIGLAKVKEAYD